MANNARNMSADTDGMKGKTGCAEHRDENLPAVAGLRGLFVQLEGMRVSPRLACEVTETIDAANPTALWDKLGAVLA